MIRLLCFIFLLLTLACDQAPRTPTTAPVGSRSVADPDRIFFKNVRASRYRSLDDYEENRTQYLHRKLEKAPTGWQLTFVDDWLNDRAWLAFSTTEPGNFYRVGAEEEEIILLSSQEIGDLAAIREFGNRLAATYAICYRPKSETVSDCLPAESPLRLAARETIADYLRFTGAD